MNTLIIFGLICSMTFMIMGVIGLLGIFKRWNIDEKANNIANIIIVIVIVDICILINILISKL